MLGGCTVKSVYVTPDYHDNESNYLKRIHLYISSTKLDKDQKKLFVQMSRKFISRKKDYIVYPQENIDKSISSEADQKSICKSSKDINGIIINEVSRSIVKKNWIDLAISSRLVDCKNNKVVWKSTSENKFKMDGFKVSVLVKSYLNSNPESVRSFIPPFYDLIRTHFLSLPNPKLTEDEIDEKIEVDTE